MLNAVLNPTDITIRGLASSHFARRYFGNLFWFLFLRLLRCFSSAGLPTYTYFIQYRLTGYCPAGFPHSDICGSTLICSSPQLFAAYHVLLRLLMPRHSPCALLNLTSSQLSLLALCSISVALRFSARLLLFPKKSLRAFSGALLRSALLNFLKINQLLKRSLVLLSDFFIMWVSVLCYTFKE